MKLIDRRFVVAVLTIACLTAVLLIVTPIRSSTSGLGGYDPWLDVNDDGKIDMKDIGSVAFAFGTSGQNISKASLDYDSSWIDITDKCGQNITITHNLNSTDIMVDIQGKTTLDGGLHQRYYGLTPCIPGWSHTYGGTNAEMTEALVRTSDGGYALAGYTSSSGAGGYDFWLVKTDANGNKQWNKTYGGTGDDHAGGLVQTSDCGYVLVGYTNSFGAGGYDGWLVKTDSNGNMQWNKTYGGTSDDFGCALVQISGGGYVVVGYVWNGVVGSWNYSWLIETDSNGNTVWTKTYAAAPFGCTMARLVQTGDGGYALAGWTASYSAGGWNDPWLMKTDSSGNALWNKTYPSTSGGQAYALVQTGDNGYALAGFTIGASGFDGWLAKTDSNGNMLWSKTYGGTGKDVATAFVQTSDGGYALAGYTNSFGAGYDFWLVKTDANGNKQWNKTYGGTGDDEALALVQTGDGGYALAGYTNSFGAGGYDAWLVKTDVEFGLAWTDSSANTITLYRGATDAYWNFVRVRLWKPR